MTGKYVYGFNDYCLESDKFGTAEEALEAARKDVKTFDDKDRPTEVYIGVVGELWKPVIGGESIIDMLSDEAYDEGGDYAEDYLKGVTKEQRDELTDVLTQAFAEWAKKYGYEPTFYSVENIKEYKL